MLKRPAASVVQAAVRCRRLRAARPRSRSFKSAIASLRCWRHALALSLATASSLLRWINQRGPQPIHHRLRIHARGNDGSFRWPQFVSGVILVAAIAGAGAILKPELWAGATFFLTWCLIGLMALGALIARGTHREPWLGAAFFGAGFMILVFGRSSDDPWPAAPTVEFLNEVRPWLPAFASGLRAKPESVTAANARILAALNRPVPMHFAEETPLDDVLKLIQQATAASDGKGIPIYVDPIGLSEADKTMTSTIRNVELDGVKLRVSLRLCLQQLDLGYCVRDGFLLITSQESLDTTLRSNSADAYQVVGHCVLALIAAGIGSLAGPFVCGLARKPAA